MLHLDQILVVIFGDRYYILPITSEVSVNSSGQSLHMHRYTLYTPIIVAEITCTIWCNFQNYSLKHLYAVLISFPEFKLQISLHA